jgi:hypothetical protein
MKVRRWFGGLILVALMVDGCIEPYDPPLNDSDVNLLVVDGFLNASDALATVTLSRTQPVNGTGDIPAESGAQIVIEDGSGLFYPLAEVQPGTYNGLVPNASSEERYRLIIKTAGGRDYASSFVTVVETPAIDSVTWAKQDGGIEFYVNTHDPSNLAQYFRWKFVETYEYNATFNSLLKFEGQEVVGRPRTESLFTCWRTTESTGIILGSTKQLEQAVVSRYPITYVPGGSIKLRARYSLLVQQQALTVEAYDYWLNLEKSTEHLGGLFDPLPSEVKGNIHSQSNPSETVIGFFGAGTMRERRLFVRRSQLPQEILGRFNGNPSCVIDTVYLNELDQIHQPTTLLIDGIYAPFAGLIGYSTAPVYCADCRTLGGTTVRPTFWD